MPRRVANHFFNAFTRVLSGLRMSDAGTGIMLARAGALDRMPFNQLTSGYQFHPQLNLMIYGDPELVVAEVPLCWRDAAGRLVGLTGSPRADADAADVRVASAHPPSPHGDAVVAASRGNGSAVLPDVS